MKLSKQELAALQCIYEGTNSIIYRQDTSEYGVPVIIKLSKHAYPTPRQIVKFATEYALTRDLDLPGIRKAYETGTIDDRPALILDYVEGETVRQAFVAQRKSLAEMLTMAIAIAQTLGEIHRHNIIHKNINSHHILVNLEQQTATIIDFGIASQIDLKTRHPEIPEVLEGTLAYISPEQTGRMNRSVDYRTDLYSLGVALYEMLTGRLPFDATDASELVHCHIARRPAPVCEVNSDIPEVVSDIVMKLMAKNAEDRYQSAFGLVADLENCLNQLEETGTVQGFELAREDFSERLEIPQKLYGREQEIQTLIQAFERVTRGASEIVLVSGPPGVGKSCLVHELGRFVAEKGGYFVSGNCDQYRRNIPYDAMVRAFAELVNVMLTEGTNQLAQWKARILEAIGDNGQVLIKAMPSLEWIIGRQSPVQELNPTEAQQRFLHVSRDFVQTITQKEHPLVFFIDDLQWADVASLDFLNLLVTAVNNHPLLFIGAYRDDQVGASHPLMQMVTDMEQKALEINTIRLENLSYDAVNLLLSDALRSEPSEAQSLVDLVYEKTGGNAFFATEFLQSLYEEGLLTFCFETRRWGWDITRIRDKAVTDDVATLMTHKIETLPETTREMLMLAACIGNTFTLKTLAAIAAQPVKTAFNHLWQTVEESLVLPLDDNYKVMLAWTDEQPPIMDCHFEFSHSRVRQAAYSLMLTRQKRAVHLAIGRLRLQETEETRLEEHVFDIVDHLNEGFRYIQDEQEKLRLAELNLIAGCKAKNGAAYQAAIWYLSMGIGLLPPDKWERYYDLTRNLYTEAVEAEYLSANFERAKLLSEEALQRARDIQDKIRVHKLQILVYRAQNQNVEATEAALAALETLDVLSPTELAYRPPAAAETPTLLDTATVIKASHMLSQEIRLEQLLDKMIHIVIENAGAEKGILIEDKNGRLVIQAIGQVGQQQVKTMQATPVEESGEVPLSVVNYVTRTQTPVVLSDASRDSTYAADRYIAEHHIRSLLCLPIVHQAKLSGLLYLENNLTTNVFTPDRLELLEALSSQAAISMQNANLYASLEDNIRELKQAEQALKNSERQLADIISFLPDATFAVDLDGKVILWNRAAEEFTGVPAGDMLGKGDYEYAIPFYGERRPILIDLLFKSAPEIERLYPSLRREGEMIFGESYTQSARRGEAYLTTVAAPLYDSQGNVIGAIETIHDITKRKQTEAQLLASEQLFRALVENSPDFIARYDREFRRIYVNPAIQRLFTGSAEGVLGKTPADQSPLYAPQAYIEHLQQAIETATESVLETPFRTAQGEMHWAQIRFVPEFDSEGKVATVLAIGRDIHEIKENEQRFRMLAENFPDFVIRFDRGGRHTYVNPAVENAFGMPAEAIVGKTLQELPQHYDPKQVDELLMLIRRAFDEGIPNESEAHWDTETGERIFAVRYVPEKDAAGNVVSVLSIARDVTESKRAEEELKKHRDHLEELVKERTAELVIAKEAADEARLTAEAANRAKSEFLANMSHELRTPLNAILGYAQLLKREKNLTAKQKDQLNTMYSSGEYLLTLISDLLDLTRIEVQRMDVDMKPFNLPALLHNILDASRLKTKERNLFIRYDELSPIPDMVVGDARKLRQILLNLLDNAIKYTEHGGVTLRVAKVAKVTKVTKVEEFPSWEGLGVGSQSSLVNLQFQVEDTGIGISEEQMQAIFEPFTRGDSRPTEGIGLGLAICRRLVELIGGRMSVATEVGKGSTFTMEVELEVAEAGEAEAKVPEKAVMGYQGARKHLLIVDDNITNLAMLVSTLDPLGFEIETANSGEEALQKAGATHPDLILLDLLMPGMDGYETLRRLRRTEELEQVKVIGVSAAIADEERTEQFAGACDAFLAKPVDMKELQEQLKEHLQIEWIEEETEAVMAPISAEILPVDEGKPEKWPPQTIVEELLENADQGDFTRLENILDRLESEDNEYKGFCDKIRAYSKRFDDDAIINYLSQ